MALAVAVDDFDGRFGDGLGDWFINALRLMFAVALKGVFTKAL